MCDIYLSDARHKGGCKPGFAVARRTPSTAPLEYLFTSSGASIESFRLSRLNAIANLRKELHEIFDEWVEAEVQARLAQGLLARKNSENLAAASSITINSGEKRAAQIAATRSTIRLPTRLPTRTATRRTAAADSAARSCIARLGLEPLRQFKTRLD